jgi:hypothetical protein
MNVKFCVALLALINCSSGNPIENTDKEISIESYKNYNDQCLQNPAMKNQISKITDEFQMQQIITAIMGQIGFDTDVFKDSESAIVYVL